MDNNYDHEREQAYLLIEDNTGSFENTPLAMRVGGTRVIAIAPWEFSSRDEHNVRAEYDEKNVSVRFYVGEHTANTYVAVTPLSRTGDGTVRLFDADNDYYSWTIRYTADDSGETIYGSANVPDFGAWSGVAPSGFTAVDRFDGGADMILVYPADDPAFCGKAPERIIGEFSAFAEELGFGPSEEIQGTYSDGSTEFNITSYADAATGRTVISVTYGI